MPYWRDVAEEFRKRNLAKKSASALYLIGAIAHDFVVISFIFGCVWLFEKTGGHLLGEGGVEFFGFKLKFIDVVGWGDLGTLMVFIGKNVAELARSEE